MSIEENAKKIEQLSADVSRMGKFKKQVLRIFGPGTYVVYQQKECELRLRIILNKWYHNEPLTDQDFHLVSGYTFYTFGGFSDADGPDPVSFNSMIQYASGNFSQEEKEMLKAIDKQRKAIRIERNQQQK